jgi:hypothetical protein
MLFSHVSQLSVPRSQAPGLHSVIPEMSCTCPSLYVLVAHIQANGCSLARAGNLPAPHSYAFTSQLPEVEICLDHSCVHKSLLTLLQTTTYSPAPLAWTSGSFLSGSWHACPASSSTSHSLAQLCCYHQAVVIFVSLPILLLRVNVTPRFPIFFKAPLTKTQKEVLCCQ